MALRGDSAMDRPPADRTTRQALLRRAGAGAAVLVASGLTPVATARPHVAGATRFAGRELKETLRIIQWSHFVPAYDKWFDNVYVKRWGEANDTEVIVDHVSQMSLPAAAAAEVASQSGHDLFQFLTPPAAYQDQVIDHKEIVQSVASKRGKMADVAHRSTYNPRTGTYFAFADGYPPDPIHYRTDLWAEAGVQPDSWDNVLKAAPKLRELGHPIGIGMSNEIDSNMSLTSLLMCFGGFIQDERQRVTLNSKGTVEALKFGRELYRRGMSDEIFAWSASSNNQAMLGGRLSLTFNAISIARSAESLNPDLASKLELLPIPRGPYGRLGLEGLVASYVIWKFARNKKGAARFLADLETKYIGAFENSRFFFFPSWPRSVSHIERRLERDPIANPSGKYRVLAEIASKYTKNPGYPGFTNAAIDEIFTKGMIPQMFAEVAQGKRTPEDAAVIYDSSFKRIFRAWRSRGKL